MSAKILVVSGPNRGATYFLQDGDTFVGRAPENQIVLASTQVSKRHCAFAYHNRKVEVRDAGSSNGTFVNGVLTKKKLLQNHDRVSVGPFVLEVILPNLPAIRSAEPSNFQNLNPAAPVHIDPSQFKMEEEPKSLVGKYKKKFDDIFLPVAFDFYEKKDFLTILMVLFAMYSMVNLGFTVYPVLQRSREEVLRQAESQAKYISMQGAYLNLQAVQEGKEASLITEFVDANSEPNVRELVIVNLEGRIMAPGARLNESYNNPTFLRYRDLVQKNTNLWEKTKTVRLSEQEEIVSLTPIMVLSKQKGIRVPAAVSVAVYSTRLLALDSGTIASIYFEALAWSALLGVIYLYILYQLIHRPINQLNDDMDKVLKGEMAAVPKKFQNDDINQLIDTVNAALSRIPRANTIENTSAPAGDQEQLIVDNLMRSMEYLASKAAHAMLMLDPEMRVKQSNTAFEELTGIRGALGEVIDTVSRDESFPALIKEMAEKAVNAGNDGVDEEYDFNSGSCKIHGVALSGVPGKVESYLFLFEKRGD